MKNKFFAFIGLFTVVSIAAALANDTPAKYDVCIENGFGANDHFSVAAAVIKWNNAFVPLGKTMFRLRSRNGASCGSATSGYIVIRPLIPGVATPPDGVSAAVAFGHDIGLDAEEYHRLFGHVSNPSALTRAATWALGRAIEIPANDDPSSVLGPNGTGANMPTAEVLETYCQQHGC